MCIGLLKHVFCSQQIETQIKRRMGIGSYMSERRLVDELAKMGMSESSVSVYVIFMGF